MKKNFFFLFSLVLAFSCLAQNEPKFTVEVSNDSILLGNHFKVTFILENGQGANFQMPEFADFNVVGGPNQSSSFSMINGDVTQSLSYSFFVEPKDIGNFYIEPASIKADETVLETQPIEIIVVPNPDGIIQKPKPNTRKSETDFFERDRFFETPQSPTSPKKKKKRKTYRL